GLLWRDDCVFSSLQKQDRCRKPIKGVDRGSVYVNRTALRIRSHQGVEVARLEFVGVLGESLKVGDAELADPGIEDVRCGERGQRRKTTGTASSDGQPIWVGQPL